MARVFNFSAGPAVLPEAVLKRAAEEMLDYGGTGTSVMEMSHRGKAFIDIHARAEADLRELLAIPKNYKVLFMQGGAAAQFGIVPMNILDGKTGADYIYTGQWSKKGDIRSPEVLQGERRRKFGGQEFHLCAVAGGVET